MRTWLGSLHFCVRPEQVLHNAACNACSAHLAGLPGGVLGGVKLPRQPDGLAALLLRLPAQRLRDLQVALRMHTAAAL